MAGLSVVPLRERKYVVKTRNDACVPALRAARSAASRLPTRSALEQRLAFTLSVGARKKIMASQGPNSCCASAASTSLSH